MRRKIGTKIVTRGIALAMAAMIAMTPISAWAMDGEQNVAEGNEATLSMEENEDVAIEEIVEETIAEVSNEEAELEEATEEYNKNAKAMNDLGKTKVNTEFAGIAEIADKAEQAKDELDKALQVAVDAEEVKSYEEAKAVLGTAIQNAKNTENSYKKIKNAYDKADKNVGTLIDNYNKYAAELGLAQYEKQEDGSYQLGSAPEKTKAEELGEVMEAKLVSINETVESFNQLAEEVAARQDVEQAQDAYEEAKETLAKIQAKAGQLKLADVQTSGLQSKITKAQQDLAEAKKTLEEAKAVVDKLTIAKDWADRLSKGQETMSVSVQQAKDENGKTVDATSNAKEYNMEEFEAGDKSLIDKPVKDFRKLVKYGSVKNNVPFAIFQKFVEKAYVDNTNPVKYKDGWVYINIDKDLDHAPVLYWNLDEEGKFVGTYITDEAELVDGTTYYVAYAFKKTEGQYHLDGYMCTYVAPEVVEEEVEEEAVEEEAAEVVEEAEEEAVEEVAGEEAAEEEAAEETEVVEEAVAEEVKAESVACVDVMDSVELTIIGVQDVPKSELPEVQKDEEPEVQPAVQPEVQPEVQQEAQPEIQQDEQGEVAVTEAPDVVVSEDEEIVIIEEGKVAKSDKPEMVAKTVKEKVATVVAKNSKPELVAKNSDKVEKAQVVELVAKKAPVKENPVEAAAVPFSIVSFGLLGFAKITGYAFRRGTRR